MLFFVKLTLYIVCVIMRVTMALIERITLPTTTTENDAYGLNPGLRITIRTTTSSLSDYPEWRLEELSKKNTDTVVTDGSCS